MVSDETFQFALDAARRHMRMNRRAILATPFALTGCATVQAFAEAEGLTDATGKVNVFKTLAFAGQGVLAVANAFFPGLSALQEAVTGGLAIVAAIERQNGATGAQIADLDAHTVTINAVAMPHATMTVRAVSVLEAS